MVAMKIVPTAALILVMGLGLNGLSTSWNGYLSTVFSASTAFQAQGIDGTVTSGRLLPSCYEQSAKLLVGLVWHDKVLVRSSVGSLIEVPVNWTLVGCEMVGTFRVGLSPGRYSVDLASCTHEAIRTYTCASLLPLSVTVETKRFALVSIEQDTSIQ